MVSYLAQFAVTYAPQAISAAFNYGASATAGYLGVRQMQNARSEIQGQGEAIAGPVGGAVGDLMGRAIVGQGVDHIQGQKAAVTGAITALGNEALDAFAGKEQIKEESGMARGYRILGALGTVAIPVAIAAGAVPAAPAIIAVVVARKLPEIINSITAPVKPGENVEFIKDIVVPVAKDMAIKGAGEVVEGVVIYDHIMGAYDGRMKLGEQVGRGVAFFLPEKLQSISAGAGKIIGQIDAGRYALSDDVVTKAKENGLIAKDVVVLGIRAVDTAVESNLAKRAGGERTYVDTAKDIATIGAGIAGGAALIVLAPQTAALTGGIALISVTPNAIKWIKQHVSSPEANKPVTTPEPTLRDKIDVTSNVDGGTELKASDFLVEYGAN